MYDQSEAQRGERAFGHHLSHCNDRCQLPGLRIFRSNESSCAPMLKDQTKRRVHPHEWSNEELEGKVSNYVIFYWLWWHGDGKERNKHFVGKKGIKHHSEVLAIYSFKLHSHYRRPKLKNMLGDNHWTRSNQTPCNSANYSFHQLIEVCEHAILF